MIKRQRQVSEYSNLFIVFTTTVLVTAVTILSTTAFSTTVGDCLFTFSSGYRYSVLPSYTLYYNKAHAFVTMLKH